MRSAPRRIEWGEPVKLKNWALVAEIAGGAAVILTLAFPAAETRSNTNAVRAQTYQSLMAELNDYREMMARDAIYAEAREKMQASGWPSLSLHEKRAIRMPEYIRWAIYESAYFANLRGVLGKPEWERFAAGMCRAFTQFGGGSAMWDADFIISDGFAPMSEVLTQEFYEYVTNAC